MFRKLRRRWAHKSIKEFLEKYIETIDMGKLESFRCKDFRLGEYVVTISGKEYELNFWELCDSAKAFSIILFSNGTEAEFMRFSIKGNVFFTIIPEEYVIDHELKRQVVNLRNGRARIYPIGDRNNETNYEHIEYKNPVIGSKIVCISKVIDKSCGYVYIG